HTFVPVLCIFPVCQLEELEGLEGLAGPEEPRQIHPEAGVDRVGAPPAAGPDGATVWSTAGQQNSQPGKSSSYRRRPLRDAPTEEQPSRLVHPTSPRRLMRRTMDSSCIISCRLRAPARATTPRPTIVARPATITTSPALRTYTEKHRGWMC
ncbi:hypothetical protein INR49_024516, partial [Caranx melampygus]